MLQEFYAYPFTACSCTIKKGYWQVKLYHKGADDYFYLDVKRGQNNALVSEWPDFIMSPVTPQEALRARVQQNYAEDAYVEAFQYLVKNKYINEEIYERV